MTMDEMLTEIRALYEAMHKSPPDVVVETRLECGSNSTTAMHGSYGASAPTAADAVGGLRTKLRDAASKSASEHEARASALRAALGERDPSQALDDARVAWQEYTAARYALVKAQLTAPADIPAAHERIRCAVVAMEDMFGGGQ